jgi:hypothetical protein
MALRPFRHGKIVSMAGLVLLAGCVTTPPPADISETHPPSNLPAEEQTLPPSAATIAARSYYARVEAYYLGQGQLRLDDGREDAPFTAEELAENFIRVAFYDEFTEKNGKLEAEPVESILHKWDGPVRLAVEFGPSVPPEARSSVKADITNYVGRLSRLSGLPMRVTGFRPNHTVLILNTDEREAAAPRLRELAPGISDAAISSVTEMKPDIYCTVFSFTRGASPTYYQALTVIRGELPRRLRLACIHEELAQSLGLVADYPRARPSIFNDNEEFALLTGQDELMVRMLYDARLTAGMTLDAARPIVYQIARELVGGDS